MKASISIHAPVRERLPAADALAGGLHFNPRSLAGATSATAAARSARMISIHAPSRERLYIFFTPKVQKTISIHAPSRERPPAS